MRWFLAELFRRDRMLARLGTAFFALAAALAVATGFDAREVLGSNVWIKPLKFAISIGIYLWSVAWLLAYVPGPRWCKQWIRWGVAVSMVVEIACIAGQAARGVPSHFNYETPLDGAIFSAMGLMILFNTLLELLLLVLFLRSYPALPPAYAWGIRLGLIGAILSAAVGGVMIQHGAHTVGAADGGPGLPLVNWSRQAGDLRVAHAVGLHALQVLPLAGFLLSRAASPTSSVVLMAMVALAYGTMFMGLYLQAALGQPLLGKERVTELVQQPQLSQTPL